MAATMSDAQNQILDEIIGSRRSIRDFTDEVPSRDKINAILAAGLAGPYAEGAQGDRLDYRRFVVFPIGSTRRKAVFELLREKARAQLAVLDAKEQGGALPRRLLERITSEKLPGFATAPYLIAVAERKGVPPVEMLSIAHCLQNMWLKATALGLGFQLLSSIAIMLADEPRFWEQVGLPADTYAVDVCAIGVPRAPPSPIERPKIEEAAIWMD